MDTNLRFVKKQLESSSSRMNKKTFTSFQQVVAKSYETNNIISYFKIIDHLRRVAYEERCIVPIAYEKRKS